MQPRNTLVVIRLIEQKDKKVGQILVPANNDVYCEAEIVRVGPGSVAAEGGRSETFDLKPGQRVYVKYRRKLQHQGQLGYEAETLPYQDGEESLHLIEQTAIFGIIAQPGDVPPVKSENVEAGILLA